MAERTESKVKAIAVMTSGGDSPGMNAAVRAVVRMGLHHGLKVYGVYNGWQGAVDGGDAIEEMHWWSVGGILQRGGAFLGSARCNDFRTRDGRRKAAAHLYQLNVDGLVVIGGDGSLTGARILSEEWPELLAEATALGHINMAEGESPTLAVVGLPGSIDNDTFGSDMSIGADTALHRIVTAADQLASTASAHQRTFVMEVMGRHCGYLALASAVASGAQWVLIPEEELSPRWHQAMTASLKRSRDVGRQHNIVMVAEGARHPDGLPLEANTIQDIITNRLDIEARVTVLGHVQRGGAPSAFDRILSTRLGAGAVESLMNVGADEPPRMLGVIDNKVQATLLSEMISRSQEVGQRIEEGDYKRALDLRGHSFQDQLDLFRLLTRSEAQPKKHEGNLLILTAGHDAPGMNPCLRVVTRVVLDLGFDVVAGQYGFEGLLEGNIKHLDWMSVSGWASRGGTELGAGRYLLEQHDLPQLARTLSDHDVRAMVIVGGLDAYRSVAFIKSQRAMYPELQIPIIVIPASISNNLPGTEFSIGTDTALNNLISDIDKLKDTASANKRAFVVEVMGYDSGYLALMAAIASGAEQTYLPEEGITLKKLVSDLRHLNEGFERGKRLSLLIVNERASETYDPDIIQRILDEEGGELFDVRSVKLAHAQRGGSPSPFDRVLAARLGAAALETLRAQMQSEKGCYCVGLRGKHIVATEIGEALAEMDWPHERPKNEWFMDLCDLARIL